MEVNKVSTAGIGWSEWKLRMSFGIAPYAYTRNWLSLDDRSSRIKNDMFKAIMSRVTNGKDRVGLSSLNGIKPVPVDHVFFSCLQTPDIQ